MYNNQDNPKIAAEQIVLEEQTDKILLEKREVSAQTQLQADDILKTKQLIPHNFVLLEAKGKNYMCSTEEWKEPICERYGFAYQAKWVQIDIPHELMEKLELKKGESIIYPVYVNAKLLDKKPEFGGIVVEKVDEIFLLKPLTSEKGTQTELSGNELQWINITSNEVWNDFYWWINNNVIGYRTTPSYSRYIEFRKGEGYSGGLVVMESFLDCFKDQPRYFLDYDGSKNLTDLLTSYNSLSLLSPNVSLTEENVQQLKNYFNNLLNRYRKTVRVVEYKRGWADFYVWLQQNITKKTDVKESELEIKEELKSEYPNLSVSKAFGNVKNIYAGFLTDLRRLNFFTAAGDYTYVIQGIKPYDDNSKFSDLANWSAKPNTLPDGEKLLEEYRQETKPLRRQVLAKVSVDEEGDIAKNIN